MKKSIIKKLLLVFGLIIFVISMRSFNNMYYAPLVVLGIILIALGWRYPQKKRKTY
ncbi:MAG: hypothetical protein ISS82_00220 [Nanoarchaeota archaeon]|nr:hypothetical protein [Nanoarchaeota archaeon]